MDSYYIDFGHDYFKLNSPFYEYYNNIIDSMTKDDTIQSENRTRNQFYFK